VIDRKEIELLIRAQLSGGKDLESVTKSISKLEEAIEKQSAAAKKGETSVDELKGSLEALKTVQNDLSGKASLLGSFQKLADTIGKTEDRVTKTAKAYDEYNTKLKAAESVTDKQQERLIKLSVASDRARAALERQLQTQTELAQSLREAGIATDDLAAAEARIRTAAASLGVVYQKNQAALRAYATDVRAARDAEREMADEKAFQKKLQDAANLVKASEYVSFWTKALEESDKAQAQLAQDNTLRKLSNDAESAAKGYTTLARAADSLRPKQQSLRDVVDDIIDPSKKATASIDGLEAQITSLSKTVSAIDGPVSNYRETLNALNQSQKELARQAGLIDTFNRQVAALRAARTEFVAARAEVAQYAAEVAKGGEAGERFVRSLAEAQARAKSAASALGQQVVATRESRAALWAAGIATNDIATAQQRLTNTAKTAGAATQALSKSMKEMGAATEKANASTRKSFVFGDGGRTTLSLMQRIRGEILSLTAAYVGLFGVIRLGQGSVEAFADRQSIRNQLAIATGNDRAAIDEEYAYVKQQSNRIGLEFDRTAKGYAKFAASAALAGQSRDEIRYVFETFSEVSSVANLSADDLDGVFKALEQIYSKGKIQAEELRGQLGDRLFGAFQVAAAALKDQFPDLNKALEQGTVSSSQLVKIAEQYRKTVADQLPAAVDGLRAQQARLNNEVFDFKLAIADSGFIDAYADALKEITNFLNSKDGKNFAKEIGGVFKDLAIGVTTVAKNMDVVTESVKLFISVWAGFKLSSILVGAPALIADLKLVVAGLAALKVAAVAAVPALAAFWPVFAVIAGLAATWAIGSILYDKFEEVRKAVTILEYALKESWVLIKGGFEIAFDALPAIARNAFAAVVNQITLFVRKGLSLFSAFARAAGMTEFADSIQSLAKGMEIGYADIAEATKKARADLQAEVSEMRRLREQALNAVSTANNQSSAENARLARAGNRGGTVTPFPGVRNPNAKGLPNEAEIKKRETAIKSITKSLEALEAKIDRAQTETLSKQREAIDVQYADLSRKIQALGGPQGAELMARLTQSTLELRNVTIDKFNKSLEEKAKGLAESISGVEAQAGKKQTQDLEARQNAIVLQTQKHYDDLIQLRQTYATNGRDTAELDAIKQRLDAAVSELTLAEEKKFKLEQLNQQEQHTNDLIRVRDAQITAVNAQREAGNISDVQAAEQINAINASSLPAIQAAALATREWAVANAAIFATPADKDVFIAQMDALIARFGQAKTEYSALTNAMIQGGVRAVDVGLNGIIDAFEQIATGQKSVSEGFRGMLQAFGQFAAQFLRDIAVMILKQMIFNALAAMGGPAGAVGRAGGGVVTGGVASVANVAHTGGVVGGSGLSRSRSVSPAWFTNAPRYHTGGVMGLASDEYATILQRGEEVLTADSPRNVLNGGAALAQAMQGGGAPQSSGVRVVVVDDRAKVAEAMATAEGEQVIIQAIQRNLPTIKSMVRT
jgi:tape measure domain-containing protein